LTKEPHRSRRSDSWSPSLLQQHPHYLANVWLPHTLPLRLQRRFAHLLWALALPFLANTLADSLRPSLQWAMLSSPAAVQVGVPQQPLPSSVSRSSRASGFSPAKCAPSCKHSQTIQNLARPTWPSMTRTSDTYGWSRFCPRPMEASMIKKGIDSCITLY
jgi:hypothetical protein